MKNIVAQPLPNLGFLMTETPQDVFDLLKNEIDNILNKEIKAVDYRNYLAGNLSEEYLLSHSRNKVELFLNNLINEYRQQFGYIAENQKFKLADLWVNFQKKYDYNPLHNHGGVFSFVIWIKIPYSIEKELSVYPETKGKHASMFTFYYSNIFGEMRNYYLPVSEDWEGRCVFFPANLHHGVNPFYTSDDIRISVSGNMVMA